jgi:heme/copper-type cytochrome/quinol oxidase subunit 3
MPVGLLGMYLFLASEAMFFVGLLGSFVVLESAGGQYELFSRSSHMLSLWIGLGSAAFLISSSVAMFGKRIRSNRIAVVFAVLFLLLQFVQWKMLLDHHTIVARSRGAFSVIDGDEVGGTGKISCNARRMELPTGFDIHQVTAFDFAGVKESCTITTNDVLQDLNYGPWRNNFFACYFLFTTVHVLHLIAGMIALGWFMVCPAKSGSSDYLRDRRLGGVPAGVQIYWHFVNAVGVIWFAVLYFV